MKESVLDVLMYLFESFVDSEDEPEPNRNELREDLEEAGFREREIDRALDWLDGLHSAGIETHPVPPATGLQRRGEGYRLFIEKANGEAAEVIHSTELGTADAEYIVLSVSGERGVISFHYQLPGQASLQPVALALDAKVLSTAVAGGFVGAHIGIHARKEEP
jgi:hypothetical protein